MIPPGPQSLESTPIGSCRWVIWDTLEPIIHHRVLWQASYPGTYRSRYRLVPSWMGWFDRTSENSLRTCLSPGYLWWCSWTTLYGVHLHLDLFLLGTWCGIQIFGILWGPKQPTSRMSSIDVFLAGWPTQSGRVCCIDYVQFISLAGEYGPTTSRIGASCSQRRPPYSSWRRRSRGGHFLWSF